MYVVLIVLTIITAVLLIGVVLIQKSKGGGLASSFAGSNQIVGVRRTNSFIEKATWTLAGAIVLFSVLATFCIPTQYQRGTMRVKTTQPAPQNTATDFDTPVLPAAETPAEAPAETPAE